MSSTNPLIQLENAGHLAGDRWLVRGVSFQIYAGEILTLIGPNGSGKSTSAKMALGILEPTEGSADRIPSLRVGYVPQKLNIDWTLPLTVERFMSLTGKIARRDMDEAFDRTGTRELVRAQVRDLSGGEFQRVLLARAIARKPNLLVLDEPVQGVDFNGEIQLYELISTIRDQLSCGILLISHDIHFVMAATDKVVCLNGHMCCEGTPTDVANSDEYQKLFGPRASATLAVYKHDHDHVHLPDGRVEHRDGTITDHCHPDDGHHHDHAPKPGELKDKDHA